MKFLNIIRHAKAENNFLKNDFTRELNERGQNDSKCLNDFLIILLNNQRKRFFKFLCKVQK